MKHLKLPTAMKKQRIAMGITQEYISQKIGMAISSVGGIERGDLPAKKEVADKIASLLNTSTSSIFKAQNNKLIAK